jgi:hypothetical protein
VCVCVCVFVVWPVLSTARLVRTTKLCSNTVSILFARAIKQAAGE